MDAKWFGAKQFMIFRTKKYGQLTIVDVMHSLGGKLPTVLREDGTITVYRYGQRLTGSEDDTFDDGAKADDVYERPSDVIAAVIREHIASGGRTVLDGWDEEDMKVLRGEPA